MVRIKTENLSSNVIHIEAAGLSTDSKPLAAKFSGKTLATGSLFLEVDTGDVYAYDEDGDQWNKIAELGGGS